MAFYVYWTSPELGKALRRFGNENSAMELACGMTDRQRRLCWHPLQMASSTVGRRFSAASGTSQVGGRFHGSKGGS